MKELSIEKKAKRYDEVIKKLRDFYRDYDTVSCLIDVKEELANLIPELKESEDEKIRKQIISFLKEFEYDHYRNLDFSSWISWLEKQGEQKPIEWTKEDEKIYQSIMDDTVQENQLDSKQIDWLKSLKDRVQPKQEWSEEDKQYLLVCKNALAKYQTTDKWDADIISRWLETKIKSLSPQTTWKPSEEQMEALNYVINLMASSASPNENDYYYNVFKDLRKQLKKLKE